MWCVTSVSIWMLNQHVNRVTSSCLFQFRRLRQIRRAAGSEVTKRLVSAFILSKLDYCNAALSGLPQKILRQRAHNAATRLVTNTGLRDHITPVLKDLHWLPVNERIKHKLCLMMHQSIYSSVWTTNGILLHQPLPVPPEAGFVQPVVCLTENSCLKLTTSLSAIKIVNKMIM